VAAPWVVRTLENALGQAGVVRLFDSMSAARIHNLEANRILGGDAGPCAPPGVVAPIHRYRWIHDVPLRDGKDALKVNWFEIEIVNFGGEVTYRNSFITDLAIRANNVAELAACGSRPLEDRE
jgi:hypothetical protein